NGLVSHVMNFIKHSIKTYKKERIAKATNDDNGKNESGKGEGVFDGATHTSTVSIA
ncbi:unnamed protein product, partial [Adineta steineri]